MTCSGHGKIYTKKNYSFLIECRYPFTDIHHFFFFFFFSGTCISSSCYCRDGYTGNDCSLAICPSGVDFVDGDQIASPCSSRGRCIQVNGEGKY
jgi:hypothetical protein